MIRRSIAVALLAGLIFAGSGSLPAQNRGAAVPEAANEANAHAILLEHSIRFELPLNAAAGSNVRVAAWLISPVGIASAETPVDVADGIRGRSARTTAKATIRSRPAMRTARRPPAK
jgi:hypothetical protein